MPRTRPDATVTLTRADLARTVQPAPVATDPTICLCPRGPIPVGRFVDQQLVGVELRHLLGTGCGRGSQYVEPRDYLAAPLRRR